MHPLLRRVSFSNFPEIWPEKMWNYFFFLLDFKLIIPLKKNLSKNLENSECSTHLRFIAIVKKRKARDAGVRWNALKFTFRHIAMIAWVAVYPDAGTKAFQTWHVKDNRSFVKLKKGPTSHLPEVSGKFGKKELDWNMYILPRTRTNTNIYIYLLTSLTNI